MPDLKLDIGEGQIANAIAVALAESFSGEKRDALLRDIIRAHMSAKENNYSKETLLNQTVGNKIRTMAREAMEAQIETLRPRIAEIVRQQMGPEFEATVCAQLMAGLSRRKIEGITVSVTMAED
jgi:hypothetical protein